MSKQKTSRQQIRLERRQARKRGIQQKSSTHKPFWKKTTFIASTVVLLVVGLLYASQSKKASKSLPTQHHLSNSSVTPSLSPNSPLPVGEYHTYLLGKGSRSEFLKNKTFKGAGKISL